MKKILLIIILIFLSSMLLAIESTTLTPESVEGESIGKQITYFIDKNNKCSIENIYSGKCDDRFIVNKKESLNLGFNTNPVWVKLLFHNPEKINKSFYMEIAYPLLDDIKLFKVTKEGTNMIYKAGDTLPYSKRYYNYQNFIIPINQEPGIITYYLRIQTTSSIKIPILLWSKKTLDEHIYVINLLNGMYFGFFVVMILYTFFLYLGSREISSLTYIIYMLFCLLTMVCLTGYGFRFIWPNTPWLNDSTPFLLSLTNLGGQLFTMAYLNTSNKAPFAHKVCKTMIVFLAIMALISYLLPYSVSIRMATALHSANIIFILIISFIFVMRRDRSAYFFLVSWGCMLLGVGLVTLTNIGLLSNNTIAFWGNQVGTSMQLVLFSLGLADKLNLLKAKLQILNKNLESKFEERTEELYKSEEKLRSFLDNANDMILRFDWKADFYFINKITEVKTGYTSEELHKMNYMELIHPDYKEEVSEFYRNHIKNKLDKSFHEFPLLTKSGKTLWVWQSATSIKDDDGNILEFDAILRDITDKKKTEKELENKNIKLAKLDKIKDDFLANTSHELRTPLHGIIGISQFLLDDLSKRTIDEIRQNISLISFSGRRLLHLVDEILDYSKINNQDIYLVKTSVDIHVACDVVIELLKPVVSKKKLKIINKIITDIPLVYADENRLQQIFMNLIDNAIKFTNEGSITVNAKKIVSDDDKDMIKISISDTGIGIPVDKHTAIFEKFEQVDGSISRKYGGAGLGLSIVKQLVGLHNGTIGIESEPGHGSNFYFTMPIATDQTRIEKDEKINIKELGNELLIDTVDPIIPIDEIVKNEYYDSIIDKGIVLAVDDDVVNLEILKYYFKDTKYSLITISSPTDIFDEIHKNKIDCLLLDIMMPQVSGYDICRQLREEYTLFELPIIMLTAKNTVDDLITAFNAGANDYVTKPVTREELLVRVKTLITLKHLIHEHEESKYKALQNKMDPHYLFNVLNTIYSYMYDDVKAASEGLLKLAKTYQFLVSQSDKKVILFDEEWSFMKNYLDIQQLMFPDTYTITINKEGDFSNVFVPPLVLQPLVANIFKYAFINIKYKGEIKIDAVRKDDIIYITILDNGVGFPGDDIFGRSLGNIKKRLREQYENAQFTAENRTPPEKGAKVMMVFSVE